MIHFFSTIQNRALEIIKEAHDCADIFRDLERIKDAEVNLSTIYADVFAADRLDRELRRKYPTIDCMLDFTNTMLPPSPQVNTHKEVQCETGGPVRLNHAEKVHGLFPRDSFLLCKLTVRCIVCHYLPTMFLNNPTYILPIFIIEFLYPQGLVHLRIKQKL